MRIIRVLNLKNGFKFSLLICFMLGFPLFAYAVTLSCPDGEEIKCTGDYQCTAETSPLEGSESIKWISIKTPLFLKSVSKSSIRYMAVLPSKTQNNSGQSVLCSYGDSYNYTKKIPNGYAINAFHVGTLQAVIPNTSPLANKIFCSDSGCFFPCNNDTKCNVNSINTASDNALICPAGSDPLQTAAAKDKNIAKFYFVTPDEITWFHNEVHMAAISGLDDQSSAEVITAYYSSHLNSPVKMMRVINSQSITCTYENGFQVVGDMKNTPFQKETFCSTTPNADCVISCPKGLPCEIKPIEP